MRLVCSATIDNPEARAVFFEQIDETVNAYTVGPVVYATYGGDDDEIRESIITLFEGESRHTIDFGKEG